MKCIITEFAKLSDPAKDRICEILPGHVERCLNTHPVMYDLLYEASLELNK